MMFKKFLNKLLIPVLLISVYKINNYSNKVLAANLFNNLKNDDQNNSENEFFECLKNSNQLGSDFLNINNFDDGYETDNCEKKCLLKNKKVDLQEFDTIIQNNCKNCSKKAFEKILSNVKILKSNQNIIKIFEENFHNITLENSLNFNYFELFFEGFFTNLKASKNIEEFKNTFIVNEPKPYQNLLNAIAILYFYFNNDFLTNKSIVKNQIVNLTEKSLDAIVNIFSFFYVVIFKIYHFVKISLENPEQCENLKLLNTKINENIIRIISIYQTINQFLSKMWRTSTFKTKVDKMKKEIENKPFLKKTKRWEDEFNLLNMLNQFFENKEYQLIEKYYSDFMSYKNSNDFIKKEHKYSVSSFMEKLKTLKQQYLESLNYNSIKFRMEYPAEFKNVGDNNKFLMPNRFEVLVRNPNPNSSMIFKIRQLANLEYYVRTQSEEEKSKKAAISNFEEHLKQFLDKHRLQFDLFQEMLIYFSQIFLTINYNNFNQIKYGPVMMFLNIMDVLQRITLVLNSKNCDLSEKFKQSAVFIELKNWFKQTYLKTIQSFLRYLDSQKMLKLNDRKTSNYAKRFKEKLKTAPNFNNSINQSEVSAEFIFYAFDKIVVDYLDFLINILEC